MSHVKLHSAIKQSTKEEKMTESKVEKFSEAVTTILRAEAAAKMKKLMYVFIRVDQKAPNVFTYEIDDSRDKISDAAIKAIKAKFEEILGRVGS